MFKMWAGSGESLSAYLALSAKYEENTEANFELRKSLRAQDSQIDGPFNVASDRIGLMLLEKVGNTAVLNIGGNLVSSHEWWHEYVPGKVTSYQAIKDAVQILQASDDISRVIIQANSGGGMVSGVESTAAALRKLKLTKTVVAHTEQGAMSAMYWLLAGAGQIYADSMAQIGSIGIIAVMPDMSAYYDKIGIKWHVFKAGREKGLGLAETEFTEEEKAAIQKQVEATNNFFLTHVSRHRNLHISDSDKWAEAQVFFAGEAKVRGLVDQVATFEELLLGSTTASNISGVDTSMNIAEEKLALIAAGTPPEEVLSTAELQHYLATVSTEEPKGEPEANEPEAPAEPETPTAPTAEQLDLAKALGKAEVKAELLAEEIESLKAANESLKAQSAGLLAVAQEAVCNLQTALQKPKQTYGNSTELLSAYNGLKEEMTARFPVGRKSASASMTKEPDESAKIAALHPLRFN